MSDDPTAPEGSMPPVADDQPPTTQDAAAPSREDTTQGGGSDPASAPGAAAADGGGVEPTPIPMTAPVTPDGGTRDRPSVGRVIGYVLAVVVGGALTLAALAATGAVAMPSASPSPSPSPSASPAYVEGRTLGDPDAPVAIEIWADFQCPYCGLQARAIGPTLERAYAATGKASITFRDFAFLGQESLDSGVAARCAEQQGQFWYMHDLLFASQQGENQGAFAADRLKSIAQFAGLNADEFATCLGDATVLQAVKDETTEGRGYGITSTPTIRIIGPGGTQVLTGLQPFSAIEAAFERAATPRPSPSPGASGSSPLPSPVESSGPASSAVPSGSPSPATSPSP